MPLYRFFQLLATFPRDVAKDMLFEALSLIDLDIDEQEESAQMMIAKIRELVNKAS